MTEERKAEVQRYIDEIKGPLGLGVWEINVLLKPPDNTAWMADNEPTRSRRCAAIRLSPTFFEHDADRQRNALVHELLHLHMEPAFAMVRDDLWDERLLSADAYVTFEASFRRSLEYGLDDMAVAIARLLPPIPWALTEAERDAL